MDTLVCIKAVEREPPRVRHGSDGPVFERAGTPVVNECDDYAIDEAVRLKKLVGGKVSAVTVGPLRSADVLYMAMAKGADDALRVDLDTTDPMMVAEALAAVARDQRFDLILTGVESRDELASAVGPALAAHLDLPFATTVARIEPGEAARTLVVDKEMGGGYYQRLEVETPAVLCVQSGICRLSYAPTTRLLQARRRPLRSLSASSLGLMPSSNGGKLLGIDSPRRETDVELFDGTPREVAALLMARIQQALRG
jgi:electron transfer flavoprotein beta subunit